MLTRRFWLDTGERCVRTFFAALIGALGTGVAGIMSMPWVHALDIAAGTTVLTLFGALAAAGVGPSGSASVLDEVGS